MLHAPRVFCVLSLLAPLACASRTTPHARPLELARPAVTAPPRGLLVRAPLRVLSSVAVDGGAPTLRLTLSEDGTVFADGRLFARVNPDGVLSADGRALVVLTEASVTVEGARAARFDGADVVADDGTRMRVEDDGRVVFVSAGQRRFGPVRVEGVTESSRRTAAVLVLLEMVRARAR